jgi:DNA-directed RNA polymerase I and III subunit RPAC2
VQPAGSSTHLLTTFSESTTAIAALEKGLQDLQELCDVVTDKFIDAREKFAATASS